MRLGTNVKSLWIGRRLSTMEQLCIESFLQNGYDFDLYTYGDVKNVPDGTTLLDANEILPEKWVTHFRYDKRPSISPFSNVFRYKLLHDKGGIWVDMDVVCLRPFVLKEDYCF